MNNFTKSDLNKIESIIKEAGTYLLSFYKTNLNVLNREGRDIKLEADQAVEKLIKDKLSGNFSYPILGEEFGETESFDLLTGFVIDPIDGTMNFSRENPVFCISIGFLQEGKPSFGAIYNPVLNELYIGSRELGVFFNGARLENNSEVNVGQAILATGIPTHMDIDDDKKFNTYMSMMRKFKKIRMIGSAAQSIAWIVNGRFDAYMEDAIMLWDVCAGLALVEGVGGVYSMTPDPKCKWAYKVRAAINSKVLTELS